MLALHPTEEILLVVRKHWFVLAGPLLGLFVLIIIPPLLLTFLPFIEFIEELSNLTLDETLINLVLLVYIMTVCLGSFLLWMDYYLDMWIITTQRIIDVEQNGLFNHRMAEILLHQVQDVTIEIRGFFETILKFGVIRIQTAGEREFKIQFVSNLYLAKDIILKHAKKT